MAPDLDDKCYIGIDVGTGSARAGVFTKSGELLGKAQNKIQIYRDGTDIAEQSSDDIWHSVCRSVQEAMALAGVAKNRIGGLGFDATCSLVVLDKQARPLTVSLSGENARNIIVWMDHRATKQTDYINATSHRVLNFVGGKISPEMQIPKLLWLKENLPSTFENAAHFFDLADFLTWRATGDTSRSACTVTCKWTYLAHEKKWDASFFKEVELGELVDENFARIGPEVVDVGTRLGGGLTEGAARDLGLDKSTPVAAGLIDAHAGGLGTIGAEGGDPSDRMAYVFGTSACTMSSSEKEAYVPGVWGPYYSAMVPGLWLNEGGQSAAGEAIAFLLKMHPAHLEIKAMAEENDLSLPDYLVQILERKMTDVSQIIKLSGQMVVVPEFLGNRAPFADPNTKAVISGLDLDESIDSMIALYIAGIAGLGYGLRQIINAQNSSGISPNLVVISGGAGSSPVVKQLLADAAKIEIGGAGTDEPVLLGSAIIGAIAGGAYSDIKEGMRSMSSIGQIYKPARGEIASLHENRFKAFESLQIAAKLVRGD